MSFGDKDLEQKERLLSAVKKEVKQLMEESVTRKFVHEDSGSVTALCAAVEACLSQGLRRRALGLFKTSSTTALLHKVARHCPEAAAVSRKVLDADGGDADRRSGSGGDSLAHRQRQRNSVAGQALSQPAPSAPTPKYLWIRIALFDKQLAKIIEFLADNATKYYDRDALVADSDYGIVLGYLLVGPCALDYSRTRNNDHLWTDPPADELVQRQRMSAAAVAGGEGGACRASGAAAGGGGGAAGAPRFGRSLNAPSEEAAPAAAACLDHVESLHQNSRAALLYGKNNVLVLPAAAAAAGRPDPVPGYLSLHQTVQGLTIKWTPNQLMNGFSEDCQDKSIYWDYALQVRLDDIVYVHCHQDSETGGTVILVGQDGVQRPPIHFPRGGHMLAFLSCLETGLLPHGRLDPPVWSRRAAAGGARRRRPLPALAGSVDGGGPSTKDYVFRIVDSADHHDILKRNELMDTKATLPTKVRVQLCSTSTSSDSSTKSFSIEQTVPDSPPNICIQAVCESMRRQIISRAFYGWLAYCRHLSTVRTHLSGLVNCRIVSGEGAQEGITTEKWEELNVEGVVSDSDEVYRLAYFGGIAQELRPDVWPYLLGHYRFGSTKEQREELERETRQAYENTMSEWLAVEAIVRQRDKENQARAIAKLSSESTSGGELAPPPDDAALTNEVFEDDVTDEEEERDGEAVKGEEEDATDGRPKKTKQNTIKYESDEDNDGGGGGGGKESKEQKPEDPLENPEDPETNNPQNVKTEDSSEQKENSKPGQQPVNEEVEVLVIENGEKTAEENQQIVVQAGERGGNEEEGETKGDNESAKEDEEQDDSQFNGDELRDFIHNVIVTNPSVDMSNIDTNGSVTPRGGRLDAVSEEVAALDACAGTHGLASPAAVSACASPASSNGGVYTQELLETFGLNLHRIEKDVQRCDRNYWYFAGENLDKLRNVMCTYVWEHLDVGYMQGMCDLAAPLLVVFDDEALAYACFCHLMERMVENFPCGCAMDAHFGNMRSLVQVLDAEMHEQMRARQDATHFYFAYRWFLLDFKRELVYPDVFLAWETIWAATRVSSEHFVLFIALALLETYRDVILANSMDFVDIIKFFNEMAERHDASAILKLARELVLQLQLLIENK